MSAADAAAMLIDFGPTFPRTTPMRSGLGLLRRPDFARLFFAYLVTYTGSAMTPIAMAFGVLDLTGSARGAAFVIAAPIAAQVVVMLIGGTLADRRSRQRIMVRADAAAALTAVRAHAAAHGR